jgi:phosphatidylglycerol:prolipoprotein diacylglycerol transferase
MYRYLPVGDNTVIPMYNMLIAIGAILGFLYLEKEIKKQCIDFKTDKRIYISLIISLCFGFTGAKLFELFYHGTALNMQTFLAGGITFMGGFVTGATVFMCIATILKINNLTTYNLIIPSVVITHFFGRIGCFLQDVAMGNRQILFLV